MKLFSLFLAVVFGAMAPAAFGASENTRALGHAELRSLAELTLKSSMVAEDAPVVPVPAGNSALPTKLIVGDGTSSLSHAKAIDLAQRMAGYMPGAAVADLSADYTGNYSPMVPSNSVLVIEAITFASVRAFDLVVFTDPRGTLRCRQLLAKNESSAIVGFAFLEQETQAEIASKAIVGRVVMTIRYDPATR